MSGGEDQELRDALKRVARVLKAADVPFALTGGYALWARGAPEPDHDVDFVLVEQDVPRALRALEEADLRVCHPPEDWLEKVYDGNALVDLIFRPSGRPVTREQLARAQPLRVDSVVMPVESATDVLVAKLLALSERHCDLSRLIPHARALREQIDWAAVRRHTAHSPFARAFLLVCDGLGITPPEREDIPSRGDAPRRGNELPQPEIAGTAATTAGATEGR